MELRCGQGSAGEAGGLRVLRVVKLSGRVGCAGVRWRAGGASWCCLCDPTLVYGLPAGRRCAPAILLLCCTTGCRGCRRSGTPCGCCRRGSPARNWRRRRRRRWCRRRGRVGAGVSCGPSPDSCSSWWSVCNMCLSLPTPSWLSPSRLTLLLPHTVLPDPAPASHGHTTALTSTRRPPPFPQATSRGWLRCGPATASAPSQRTCTRAATTPPTSAGVGRGATGRMWADGGWCGRPAERLRVNGSERPVYTCRKRQWRTPALPVEAFWVLAYPALGPFGPLRTRRWLRSPKPYVVQYETGYEPWGIVARWVGACAACVRVLPHACRTWLCSPQPFLRFPHAERPCLEPLCNPIMWLRCRRPAATRVRVPCCAVLHPRSLTPLASPHLDTSVTALPPPGSTTCSGPLMSASAAASGTRSPRCVQCSSCWCPSKPNGEAACMGIPPPTVPHSQYPFCLVLP